MPKEDTTEEPTITKLCFNDIPQSLAWKFKAACTLQQNEKTGKPYKQREAIIELMKGFVARTNDESITL